jgi:AmmeMemoRadiSam system protein A
MDDRLTEEERCILLTLARQGLIAAVNHQPLPILDLSSLPNHLCQIGASFVTLTRAGDLRGCIGTLEATLPLVLDVMEHTAAAALYDYRFAPVQPEELDEIEIEISRLTAPAPLEYRDPAGLLGQLQPGIDGIVLRDGPYRATFLPQVWEKIPDPALFLNSLCEKMGVSYDLWRHKKMQVSTYRVEEFREIKE